MGQERVGKMMSKPLKEQYEKAKEIDSKIRADDDRFNGAVHIIDEDEGTVLFYERAFAEKHSDWWYIFTEHHGLHVYDDDEVQVRMYKRIWE